MTAEYRVRGLARLLIVAPVLGLAVTSVGAQPRPEAEQLADLEVHAVALADNGAVVYQLANRGKAATERPFVVEIYVNGVRADAITHSPLPALSVQTAQSNRARFTECKAGTVRVVLDAQNSVREVSKTNNQRTAQLVPACARSTR